MGKILLRAIGAVFAVLAILFLGRLGLAGYRRLTGPTWRQISIDKWSSGVMLPEPVETTPYAASMVDGRVIGLTQYVSHFKNREFTFTFTEAVAGTMTPGDLESSYKTARDSTISATRATLISDEADELSRTPGRYIRAKMTDRGKSYFLTMRMFRTKHGLYMLTAVAEDPDDWIVRGVMRSLHIT